MRQRAGVPGVSPPGAVRGRAARAAVVGVAVLGPAAVFVTGGPVNLAGALILSAMFYPMASRAVARRTPARAIPGSRRGGAAATW